MAHAGTATGLAKQPATSTNGLWQPLFAVIVILAIAAGMVLVGTNAASQTGVTAPAAGNRIEAQRGPTTAAAALIHVGRIEAQRGPTTAAAALIFVGDGSYDQVEKNRGAATLGGGVVAPDRRFDELMLAPVVDGSYTQVETNRGGAFSTSDDSYTQAEKNRGGALTAPKAGGTGPGPGTSGFVPDYGPGTSGTVPGYGPGRILGHRAAEIDQ